MDVVFQPARDMDADVLLSMARAFHIEDGHPLDTAAEAAVVQIARGEPFARAWIVWQGAAAVGYVVITLGYSVEYGGRDGFIDDLYLIAEARGRGLGRKVLAFAIAEAARLGIRTLHLEVETANEHADDLYRAAGFELTGRRLRRLRLRS